MAPAAPGCIHPEERRTALTRPEAVQVVALGGCKDDVGRGRQERRDQARLVQRLRVDLADELHARGTQARNVAGVQDGLVRLLACME